MAEGDNIVKQMTLLPEYQEKFLKDLLANIYQVDEVTKEVTGIASKSPCMEIRSLMLTATLCTSVQMESRHLTQAKRRVDQYGNPVFATEGGVAAARRYSIYRCPTESN